MDLLLYNTETRVKQSLRPLQGDTFLLYTCGPTVYNFAHIGNFRTYVVEDMVRRVLQFCGWKVRQVMNLTDVDDKTIKGAIQNSLGLLEYTKPYIEAFFSDLQTLGIQAAEVYPAATDYIQDMIVIIQRLMDQGIAYVGKEGSVYFRISAFPAYGRLSHLDLQGLQVGARIADEYDKNEASDFVLWKAYDADRDGEIYWDSPFGVGRPGWHIECSAMAMKILGETIDIHMGGVDNIFPHHENEIAQAEAFSGKTFVRHWLHVEHLLVDHKKMSKSLGNFYTLRDLLDRGYKGVHVRYALLQGHYRAQLNFTFEGLDAAKASVQRIFDCMDRLEACQGQDFEGDSWRLSQEIEERFGEALRDDLQISLALSHLFEGIRQVHVLCDLGKIGTKGALRLLQCFYRLDEVLGIIALREKAPIPAALQEALQKREQARKDKNWQLADSLRAWIIEQGYRIEDSPAGPVVKKGE